MPEKGGHGLIANCLSPSEFCIFAVPCQFLAPGAGGWSRGFCRGEIHVAAGWEE